MLGGGGGEIKRGSGRVEEGHYVDGDVLGCCGCGGGGGDCLEVLVGRCGGGSVRGHDMRRGLSLLLFVVGVVEGVF